jgi:hypothetical protein
LTVLEPAILHLGGEEAKRGILEVKNKVCSQWK